MPKGTLSFKLPEERQEFYLASKATQLADAASTLDEWFRQKLKHGHITGKTAKILEEGRVLLRENLDGIDLHG